MSDQGSYRVKGSSIRSKLVFVSETFGTDAEVTMRDFLETNQVWPVLEATWYPYQTYDRILLWIAETFLGGDVKRLREVGRFSAEKALTTTYDAFRSSGDFSRFLEKLPILHSRYYSLGKLTTSLVLPGATRCEMLLEGAPVYTTADLTVATGFYTGCAELMGLQDATCNFRREGKRIRLELMWKSP